MFDGIGEREPLQTLSSETDPRVFATRITWGCTRFEQLILKPTFVFCRAFFSVGETEYKTRPMVLSRGEAEGSQAAPR